MNTVELLKPFYTYSNGLQFVSTNGTLYLFQNDDVAITAQITQQGQIVTPNVKSVRVFATNEQLTDGRKTRKYAKLVSQVMDEVEELEIERAGIEAITQETGLNEAQAKTVYKRALNDDGAYIIYQCYEYGMFVSHLLDEHGDKLPKTSMEIPVLSEEDEEYSEYDEYFDECDDYAYSLKNEHGYKFVRIEDELGMHDTWIAITPQLLNELKGELVHA